MKAGIGKYIPAFFYKNFSSEYGKPLSQKFQSGLDMIVDRPCGKVQRFCYFFDRQPVETRHKEYFPLGLGHLPHYAVHNGRHLVSRYGPVHRLFGKDAVILRKGVRDMSAPEMIQDLAFCQYIYVVVERKGFVKPVAVSPDLDKDILHYVLGVIYTPPTMIVAKCRNLG